MEERTRSSIDRLSDLHSDILWLILKKLPLRDLIRMSLLCRPWRDKWTTTPYLTFNNIPMPLVINALNRHKGMVQQLVVSFDMDALMFRPHYLIQLLLLIQRKDVQDLTIELPIIAKDQMLSLIFCCRPLHALKLGCCTIDKVPFYFEGFRKLRILDLSLVTFSKETAEVILSHSPIRKLRMQNCCGFTTLELNAPHLQRFLFQGSQCVSFRNTPQLDYIHVNILYPQNFDHDTTVKRLDEIIGGLVNCRELCAQGRYMEILSRCIIPEMLTLTNMRHLKLMVNFRNANHLRALLCLARSSLHLETLVVRNFCFIYKRVSQEVPYTETFFPHLQRCELSEFRGTVQEKQFIKSVLSRAPNLKFLLVQWSPLVLEKFDDSFQIMGFDRASLDVDIRIKSPDFFS